MNLYIQKGNLNVSTDTSCKEFPVFHLGDTVELDLNYSDGGKKISFLESDEITIVMGRRFGNKILSHNYDSVFTLDNGIATMYLSIDTDELHETMSNRDFLDLDIEIKLTRGEASTTIVKSPCVVFKTLSSVLGK